MIFIEENRALYLDVDGNWELYGKEKYKSKKACLESFATKKHILIEKKEFVVDKGNIIINNLGEGKLEVFMPGRLNDEQLYQLDLFASFSMDNIKYADVTKYTKGVSEKFLLTDDVAQKFSNEVIQSYYNKPVEKRKNKQ